jgi:hypothetical protein
VTILDAIHDPNLFRPFLGPNLATWDPWLGALATLYGLRVPTAQRPTARKCTGRNCSKMPAAGFLAALFLTGRRSGKSRIAAIVAAFEAALSGREKLLAKGEQGIVAVVSPTRAQSRIVHGYVRAIFDVPLLKSEIVAETASGFELRNSVRIEILTGFAASRCWRQLSMKRHSLPSAKKAGSRATRSWCEPSRPDSRQPAVG